MSLKAILLLLAAFLYSPSLSYSATYPLAAEYFCDTGILYYQQKEYDKAILEFKKALLADPYCYTAKIYIEKSQTELFAQASGNNAAAAPASGPVRAAKPKKIQPGVVESSGKAVLPPAAALDISSFPQAQKVDGGRFLAETPSPSVVKISDIDSLVRQPLEIEQGRKLSLVGQHILRYLATENIIISVEQKTPDILMVSADNIGYTYLYVWDDNGRKTIEFLILPRRLSGESLEERMRLEEERSGNFRLNYQLDWGSFESGRRLKSLERTDYYYNHFIELYGDTPYGRMDAAVGVNRFTDRTDLGRYTMGLTEGRLGPFKDFNLRGFDIFDFPPKFSNLSYTGSPLRGGLISSPAFNNKLEYTLFYGRENSLPFGAISPDFYKQRDAYINGFNLSFRPGEKQGYELNFAHGWGRDREEGLNPYTYDISGEWGSGAWKARQELAFDSDSFAHLSNLYFAGEKLNLSTEFRDVSKKFTSITSDGWRQGEVGGSFTANYRPTEKLDIYSFLDIYRDRLYPSPEDEQRLNEDLNWSANYRFDPKTTLRLDYTLQNDLGRISPFRYQSSDIGLVRSIRLFRDIELSATYYHQKYQSFSNPPSDYINDRLFAGMRLSLLGRLYYYANKEFNWLDETYNRARSTPNVFETGLDWSDRIGKGPFSGTLRLAYRDEEDSASSLSFLSGEDYIEGYAELTYSPDRNTQMYGSVRVRNVWADNPDVSKRYELNLNAGMRYNWDTGLNWQSSGDIEGYVFKDLNGDGIMDRDEAPVEGVKVWLGKNKHAVTDLFGYYRFKSVRGKNAYVNLDTSTLPSGFVLTAPASQKTGILHHRLSRLDFGINCRSEISGYVFEDLDGNGELNIGEPGVRGAVMTLNNREGRATDENGRYVFSSVRPGDYVLELDLNSLPVYYLPTVALSRKVTLNEGAAYYYNIPLRRNDE